MSLKAWQGVLGTAHLLPLPLDLEHAVSSFESWRNVFKDSLGVIILVLFLKIPAARDAFVSSWGKRRRCENEERVFLSLQDMTQRMQDPQVLKDLCEQTKAIGGPLHAHGWLMLLHHFDMIKEAGSTKKGKLLLGVQQRAFQLCRKSDKAMSGVRAFMSLHSVLQTIFLYGAPKSVEDWFKPAHWLRLANMHAGIDRRG